MENLNRIIAPDINDYTNYEIDSPRLCTLSNGIILKQFDNPQLDLIHLCIKIKAGSCYESKKNVAAFCYLLLKESAAKHDIVEVDEFLDYYGVNYSASISVEYVTISIIIPKNNCLVVLPYIFDFLSQPKFKEINLNLLRDRKLKDLANNKEKVGYCASQLMLHHLFGNSCLVGKILEETDLKAIGTDDLAKYHQQTFCAENIRIFLAGNVSDDISSCIRQLFEAIPHGKRNILDAKGYQPKHVEDPIVDIHEGCLQSSFYLCRKSLAYTDEQRRDFGILATILGGYFGSRLMSNLRETNGYTYGVGCGTMYYENESLFYIESEVNVEVTLKAIGECFKEMEVLCTSAIGQEELDSVKNYLSGQLLRKIDNTVSLMTQYANWDDFGLGDIEFKQQLQAIKEFNADKAIALSQKYLQKNQFLTIISGNIQ